MPNLRWKKSEPDLHNLYFLDYLINKRIYPFCANLRTTRYKYIKQINEGKIPMPEKHTFDGDPEKERLRAEARLLGEEIPFVEKELTNEEALVRIAALEGQLRTALRQRDKAKDKTGEMVLALRQAVGELYSEITIDPPNPRRIEPRRARGLGQTAIVSLSDWQLGKKTPTYSSEVCEERIQLLADTTLKIAHNQNKIDKVTDVNIFLLGDMLESEGIFPNQAHQIDSSLYKQLVVDGPRILGNFVGEMGNFFKNVHVTGVVGNHNIRIKSDLNPETNPDRMLYKIVEQMYSRDKMYTFDVPDGDGERNFYAVSRIYDWGFLLVHGDQIRGGFAGFPFYGAAKKAWGWIDSIEEPWDYMMAGHYHTPTRLTLNKRTAYFNGSTESSNTYAQEQLSAIGFPTQYVGFVHPEHGITADHWVNLGGRQPNLSRYIELGKKAVEEGR